MSGIPVCPIHSKPMKYNSKGWYCSTPVEKNGNEVTKWCTYKPGDGEQEAESPSQEVREPVKERNFDSENRGKVRHGIVVAMIEQGGLNQISEAEKMIIDELVEYIMTGT